MDAEAASRALHAASDLLELLRLTHGALERIEREVHGASYEQADTLGRDLHRLRRQAERLQSEVQGFVSREGSAPYAGARR